MSDPAAGATRSSDLDSRAAIHDLIVDFYREVAQDDVLGPVFGEVAEVDWAVHIPKLIDYWCRVLLRRPGYDGFILRAHERVNDLAPFEPVMFDRWYQLFVAAVDGHFAGPVSEQAKAHAAQIAGMLSRKVTGEDWAPTRRSLAG